MLLCSCAGPPPKALHSGALPEGCKYFTYRELEEATQGWARSAIIGDGGFGRVYKGQLRGGEKIAAKRLDRHGMQVLPPLSAQRCHCHLCSYSAMYGDWRNAFPAFWSWLHHKNPWQLWQTRVSSSILGAG